VKGIVRKVTDHTIPMKRPITSRPEAVVCHECGKPFTPTGLAMHAGTAKCRLTQRSVPLKAETEKEQERMRAKSKAPVVKNVASALYRRNLEGMCGLESASTKLIHTDVDCLVLEEYWVYEWVYRIWKQQNDSGYTRTAYALLEELNEMSQDQRESEIGIIMLGMYA
jgi:hypothetical protein